MGKRFQILSKMFKTKRRALVCINIDIYFFSFNSTFKIVFRNFVATWWECFSTSSIFP